jgi:hypothetical protein
MLLPYCTRLTSNSSEQSTAHLVHPTPLAGLASTRLISYRFLAKSFSSRRGGTPTQR